MTTEATPGVDALLRELAAPVLAVIVRRHRQFDLCEDAVQEALIAAARQWPEDGVPDNPRGWLVTVAERRAIDTIRTEDARRRREETYSDREAADGNAGDSPIDRDDSLMLLVLCCHPALTPASQIALTLRAVGGLTTAEIAGAFSSPNPRWRNGSAERRRRSPSAARLRPPSTRTSLTVASRAFCTCCT